jgi:hypothetical protein
MILMLNLILSVVLAGLIHELGHYLTALTFGHHLVFRRQGIRFIWDMPNDTPQHQRLIALSGFGTEIVFSPLLYLAGLWLYPWVVAVHLMAYPFYAGDYNDFRWGK